MQSFELFIDLLYVGIIAINGDATSEDPTGLSLLRFVITFTLSYKIWNDMALVISWFETDDVFQRVSILILIALLFGYTTNITQAFDTTYATLIGFYLAARLFMASYLLLVAYLLPSIRYLIIYHCFVILIGAALWIGSIHTAWPGQLALIWIAIVVDLVGTTSHVFLMMFTNRMGPKMKGWFETKFEFVPGKRLQFDLIQLNINRFVAINIEHRTERTNAFVTLVFGYTVVAILYQSTVNGIDAFFGKAVLGLIQAFVYNWLYVFHHFRYANYPYKHALTWKFQILRSRQLQPPDARHSSAQTQCLRLVHGTFALHHVLRARWRRTGSSRRCHGHN